ncbi:hypothetical protein JCM1841_000646 [Sporobolomyces salmonicolor]
MDKTTTIRAARHSAAPYDKNNRSMRLRTRTSRDDAEPTYNLRQRPVKSDQQPAVQAAPKEATAAKSRNLRQRPVKVEQQPIAPVAPKKKAATKPKSASKITRQEGLCTPKSTAGSLSSVVPKSPPKPSPLPACSSHSGASSSRPKASGCRPTPSRSTALATRAKPYARPSRPSASAPSRTLSHCQPLSTTATSLTHNHQDDNHNDEPDSDESDSDESDSDESHSDDFDSDDFDSDESDSDEFDSDESNDELSNNQGHFTAYFGGRFFDLTAGTTMAEQDELMDDAVNFFLDHVRGKKVKLPKSLQRFTHLQDHTRFSEIMDEV